MPTQDLVPATRPRSQGPTETEILESAQQNWRAAFAHWSEWRSDAKEDFNFVSGDQWEDEDKRKLSQEDRPAVVFNRIGPLVDAVIGQEVTNRQEVRYVPRTLGASGINEAFTAAAKYLRDQCGAEDEETDAFFDCVVCGLGWTETRIDFDEDPDGKLIIARVDPFEIWADPAARQRNLQDGRFLFRVKDLTKDEIEATWPGASSLTLPGTFVWGDTDSLGDEPTTEPVHIRTGRQYEDGDHRKPRRGRKRYRVVEYQWKEWVPVYRLIDPTSGNEVTFDERRFKKIQEAFRLVGGELPPNSYIKQKRRQVKRAFIIGDTVLEYGEAPHPLDFTYTCITGKRDQNRGVWYGLVRPTKDPQRWANKFFSQVLQIINTNAKGGLIAEVDAFDDWREAEEAWARSDSIVWAKPGGIERIQPKPAAAIPPDITNMMLFAVSSLRDVTGINLELLGMAQQDQAGVLEYQRRQAGVTILATLFDSLRRYRKTQGHLLLYFIQNYIPEGRLIKVDGSFGPQYIPLMKDPDVVEYDVIVDDAPSSPNLKEQVFAVLQVLIPQMVELGMHIPQDVLDYLPLPEGLVQAFRQANAPQDQGGQQQQDPTMAAAMQYMQLKQQEFEVETQLKQRKQMADEQLAQQKMQSDHAMLVQRLQLEREAADRKAQTELIQAQIEELRLQTMLTQATDQPQQLKGIVDQLAQTVAETHQQLLAAQQQHTDFASRMGQEMAGSNQRQSDMAGAMQQLVEMMNAPREVVRDAQGRVSGVRMRSAA